MRIIDIATHFRESSRLSAGHPWILHQISNILHLNFTTTTTLSNAINVLTIVFDKHIDYF